MTRRVAGILGSMWPETTIPFLNMLKLSIKKAIQTLPDVGRVGILAHLRCDWPVYSTRRWMQQGCVRCGREWCRPSSVCLFRVLSFDAGH